MATEAQPVKKDKIPELQLVRAMAIIGVLSVHSTSFAAAEKMKESAYYFLYNFANIFMKFGTPTFILLSSFVLFYNYYNRPLNKSLLVSFYSRRLLYIIIPYVLFSLFYFGILHVTHYPNRPLGETLESFFNKLITGKAYTHLYFVFISIQFYILFPLVLWLFKRSETLAKWAIPIGLAIQWGFVLLNKYYLPTPVPNKGSWAFSYMAYFMLGAFLGIFYPKIKKWVIMSRENASAGRITFWVGLWAFWLAAGIGHVLVYYYNRLHGVKFNSLLYEFFWNAHTYACALVLLQIAHLLYKNSSRLLVRPMERLGEISFGVYLIHPFFLLVYREKLVYTGGSSILLHAWYVGGFLLALIGSWIVVSLVTRFLPFSWLIFGQVPKPKRDRQTPAQPVVPGGIGR